MNSALPLALLCSVAFGLVWESLRRHRPLRVGDGVSIPNVNPNQGLITQINGRLRSRSAVIVLRGTSGMLITELPTKHLHRIDTSSWEHL